MKVGAVFVGRAAVERQRDKPRRESLLRLAAGLAVLTDLLGPPYQ